MTGQFARLLSIESQAGPDRRRQRRRKTTRGASIESAKGGAAKVELSDVSQHGCSIVGGTDQLRVGGFVSIALAEGKPLQAIVRWVREGKAGLEFLWPVPADHAEWHDLIL